MYACVTVCLPVYGGQVVEEAGCRVPALPPAKVVEDGEAHQVLVLSVAAIALTGGGQGGRGAGGRAQVGKP